MKLIFTFLILLACATGLDAMNAMTQADQKTGDRAQAEKVKNDELYDAVIAGSLEDAKKALDAGADQNYQIIVDPEQNYSCPIIVLAAEDGHAHIVRLLFERKAILTAKTSNEEWQVGHYAAYNDDKELIGVLRELKYPFDAAMTTDGFTPLVLAVRCGNEDAMRAMLDDDKKTVGADPLIRYGTARLYVMHTAALENQPRLIEILAKEYNVSVNECSCDSGGGTPLYGAALTGEYEVVKVLLECKADPSIANNQGWGPLHGAANYGYLEIVELLLGKGKVRFDQLVGPNGYTALHEAARKGNGFVVKVLVKAGAHTFAETHNKRTAADLAKEAGFDEIASYLKQLSLNDLLYDE